MNWYAYTESWSFILRRFLPRLALYSLGWELAQLPCRLFRGLIWACYPSCNGCWCRRWRCCGDSALDRADCPGNRPEQLGEAEEMFGG